VALQVAPDPALLEPADVAQFPQRRIELGQPGHRKTAGRQRLLVARHQVQGLVAGIHQGQRQHIAPGMAHVGRIDGNGACFMHGVSFHYCPRHRLMDELR